MKELRRRIGLEPRDYYRVLGIDDLGAVAFGLKA
jgi:hypothetical protein